MQEKMTIEQCQKLAQENGYNCATFDLFGPAGRIKCKWLDAYFGMFLCPHDSKGFTRISQLSGLPVYCENFNASGEDSASEIV